MAKYWQIKNIQYLFMIKIISVILSIIILAIIVISCSKTSSSLVKEEISSPVFIRINAELETGDSIYSDVIYLR